MSDSVRPHRQQPTRLPRPWDSPGKNTGVGCHFLLQCMKVKSESEVAQSCPTLSDPIDCSLPGSSTHGFSRQEDWSGVLEWGAIAFSNKLQSCPFCCAPFFFFFNNNCLDFRKRKLPILHVSSTRAGNICGLCLLRYLQISVEGLAHSRCPLACLVLVSVCRPDYSWGASDTA